MTKFRIEKDSLGVVKVPAKAYYGVETVRAVENYPISGLRFHPVFIWATAAIKKAAAQANVALKRLSPRLGNAIIRASDEVMAGKFNDQFVVDVFQSGAGVSQHMNTNEVIANRALEILKKSKGDYKTIHSHDHVNLGQSTNDVMPAALRVATVKLLSEFYPIARNLETALLRKSKEFSTVVKAGRTHMQDAAPITLGQEFSGYSMQVRKAIERIKESERNLCQLGIGGSAVGTGLNTTVRYRKTLVKNLCRITGLQLRSGENLFELMQSTADFAAVSGSFRILALVLIQVSNDLRLLSSGPTTGLNEIKLPARQPGSSIMPGKINPVMPEMLTMICFQMVGNDTAVQLATQAGQLELNVMIPTVIHNLLQSIEILKNGIDVFARFCVTGIEGNAKRCYEYAEKSYGIAAALNPYIGYGKAAEVVKESMQTGKSVREVIISRGILSPLETNKVLSARNLTKPSNR